jgi:hypothetical protein
VAAGDKVTEGIEVARATGKKTMEAKAAQNTTRRIAMTARFTRSSLTD